MTPAVVAMAMAMAAEILRVEMQSTAATASRQVLAQHEIPVYQILPPEPVVIPEPYPLVSPAPHKPAMPQSSAPTVAYAGVRWPTGFV